MRVILSGQYRPNAIFFDPPKEAGGALEAGNFTVATTTGDDDLPPDYTALEEKFGDGPAVTPVVVAAPDPSAAPGSPAVTVSTPEPAKTPEATPEGKVDRARGADGKFVKAGDEEPMPEIPPAKPGKAPEPDKPAVPPPAKPTEQAKPPEPPKPATPPAKAPEVPAVPADDKDLEAIEPKPTASERTKNDFKALKQIAQSARDHAREVEKQLNELKAKSGGELPPDVKERLERLDVAEKFKSMFELENEPRRRAEYSAKLESTEDAILKKLVGDPRLKLPQAEADAMKKAGFDSKESIAKRNGWFKAIRENTGDELLVAEVAEMFRSRDKVVSERAQEIEKLRTDRDSYLRERQEYEGGEFKRWGEQADKTLLDLSKGHEWTDYMKIPDGATPEQLEVINAHNSKVKDTIVPDFNNAVLNVFNRKPAETIGILFDAMRLKYEVEPKLTQLQETLTQRDARIAELEQLANGVRRVSQVSQAEQAPTAGSVQVVSKGMEGAAEQSSDDAVENYLREKGLKK